MKIEKARKIALGIDSAAFVVFLIRMLLPVSAVMVGILLWVFFALAVAGFGIGIYFCRCPHCGRGLKVGFAKITRCPVCQGTITPESRWNDYKGK